MNGDVVAVLMPALTRLAWGLEEEHRLQGHHVWADERLEHVEDAWVQHVTLVQLELAM